MFMEGLCVVIGKEYKQGKHFLPQKKKEGMSSAGRGWGGVGWGRVGYRDFRSEEGT